MEADNLWDRIAMHVSEFTDRKLQVGTSSLQIADSVEPVKRPHGSARPGGGKPKGTKLPSTLAKAEARELVRQFITERLGEFLEAMADNVPRHSSSYDRFELATHYGAWVLFSCFTPEQL